MREVNDKTNIPPRLVAHFAAQADGVIAVIEAGPGETIEDARADFGRMLALTNQVNTLIDELAVAAADPATTLLAKAHLQIVLLAAFAERCAGAPVSAHQPLHAVLDALVELGDGGSPALFDKVRAGS